MEATTTTSRDTSPLPCVATRRPWLDYYTGPGLLAQRISVAAAAACDDAADDGARLPAELWLAVVSTLQLSEFANACALARTCHTLRPISRHPELWERFCQAAFSLRGHLALDSQLRLYSWSWLKMFLRRPRLRFDGMYYLETKKLIRGMVEGRGMKETGARYV